MMLFRILQDTITNCTIAGSAALHEMLHQMPPSTNNRDPLHRLRTLACHNDIDCFVPRFPNRLLKYQNRPFNEEALDEDFETILRRRIIPQFEFYFSTHRKPVTILRRQTMLVRDERRHPYHMINLIPGIYQIINLDLGGPDGQCPFQCIVLKGNTNDFPRYAVKNFDANIVMLRVDVSQQCTPQDSYFPLVRHLSCRGRECLQKGCFDYIVRPGHTFRESKARISKYLQRGFYMRSLAFDDRIIEMWKGAWLAEARVQFAVYWVEQMALCRDRANHLGNQLGTSRKRKRIARSSSSSDHIQVLPASLDAHNDGSTDPSQPAALCDHTREEERPVLEANEANNGGISEAVFNAAPPQVGVDITDTELWKQASPTMQHNHHAQKPSVEVRRLVKDLIIPFLPVMKPRNIKMMYHQQIDLEKQRLTSIHPEWCSGSNEDSEDEETSSHGGNDHDHNEDGNSTDEHDS